MAIQPLPPPPRMDKDLASHPWQDWFYKLWDKRKLKTIETTGNPPKGTAAPTQVFLNHTSGWKFAVGDSIYFIFVIPPDWVPNTDFVFEAHFYSPNTTAARYVRGQLEWVALAQGEIITAPGSSGIFDTGDILLPTTANQFGEVLFPPILGTSISQGEHISLHLTRIASVGTAPAAADNPVLIHFEIEYTAYINK